MLIMSRASAARNATARILKVKSNAFLTGKNKSSLPEARGQTHIGAMDVDILQGETKI